MESTDSEASRAPSRRRLPRWLAACAGLLLLIAGIVLLFRPLGSVALLLFVPGAALVAAGLAELFGLLGDRAARGGGMRWVGAALAGLLIVAGLAVLLWPGITLRVVVLVAGLALIANGARDLIAGIAQARRRWANLLGGAAGAIFGVLALTWRDATVVVIGALLGLWLAIRGLRLLLESIRGDRGKGGAPRQEGGRRGEDRGPREWPQTVAAALSLALAVLLAVVGAGMLGQPRPDAFYLPPAEAPGEPGVLLRAEPFANGVPEGASAWRILYTTTREEGVPAVSSGLVIVPDGAQRAPVIAWTHGTTGAAVGCAPTLAAQPLEAGALLDPAQVIAQGWAIVATDYIGLGADAPHQYLVGQPAGRAALDALRAARQLPQTSLGEQTVVWGHSQGGAAALWTGGLAKGYAPELDIAGVAAMAPAANLPSMIAELADGVAGALVGPLVLAGFAESYDDVRVRDYLRPSATLLYDETLARCWSDPSMPVTVLNALAIGQSIWSKSPAEGPLAQRLEQNVPRLPVEPPLLIAQGLADTLVLPGAQREYIDSLCRAGQRLDYRSYEGKDHMGLVGVDSPLMPELMRWTEDRFAGRPASPGC